MERPIFWMIVTVTICCQNAIAQDSLAVKPKSKGTALAWSLGATIAPVVGGSILLVGASRNHNEGQGNADAVPILFGSVIGAAGLILGPGAGHAYAGKRHPFGRAILRGALLPTALGLAAVAFFADVSDDVGWTLLGLGVAAGTGCVFLCVYDIATVGGSVDQYNATHGYQTISIAPYYEPDNSTFGLQASLRF
jgi:hypothetical protein